MRQLARLGEHEPGQVVAERVLLPVEEVVLGRDPQRVRGTGVRLCGAGRSRTTCGPIPTSRSKA